MKLSIGIKQKIRESLVVVLFVFNGFASTAFSQSLTVDKHIKTDLNRHYYISAFASEFPKENLAQSPAQAEDSVRYTIQICTFHKALADSFFTGKYKIRLLRMGDLYRYLFSEYSTLTSARKDLLLVRTLFPQACIREYHHGKLGVVINLNIDQ